ncbi:MAG: hypothetical protein V3T70_00205, partial [Phycisphaerae bacterium]
FERLLEEGVATPHRPAPGNPSERLLLHRRMFRGVPKPVCLATGPVDAKQRIATTASPSTAVPTAPVEQGADAP